MSERPNVLILLTDQQRADHTGFGGNAVVQTPHMDSIAARGMRFDRALVANPICMPNRASILTGRMPSVHGTRYNGISLDPSQNTFARVLRERGYHTAYFGKCHLQNMGNNERIAQRIFAETPRVDAAAPPYEEGWDTLENGDRHKREYVEIPPDFYGFDEVDLTVDHADHASGHYYQWMLEQGVDPTKLQGRENALPFASPSQQLWRTALPEELYPTGYVSLRTCEFLERHAKQPVNERRPFLAVCSYPDPHHPFTPPGRYFDLYDPREIPLPETFSDPHRDSPPHYQRMIGRRGQQGFFMAPFAPSEEQLRQMAAKEYGAISLLDDGIGRVLAALEATGLADDTILVFTSDHGDMFGDHGVMLKAAMHYEGCIRVPLVIATPQHEPGVCRSLVSSLDLAQTLLSLTDSPHYYGMQGVDLAPLLADPEERVREEALIEEDQMFDILGIGRPLRMRSLVTPEARLTLYEGSETGELYDLARDPSELSNLFERPEARALRAELTERLARALMATADESPRPVYMA